MYKLYEEKSEYVHPHGNRIATLEDYRALVKSTVDFNSLPAYMDSTTFMVIRVHNSVRYFVEEMYELQRWKML